MSRRNVLVVGTGTIGEPLIGLLVDFRKDLGIDEVMFHKRTPLTYDRSKVVDLINRGAQLATDEDRISSFNDIGLHPRFTTEKAIGRASVVIDCTPRGIGHYNKKKYYKEFINGRLFIAQGSEHGFGKPYARGINDEVLDRVEDNFIHIVSCNTHNIAILLKVIGGGKDLDKNIASGRFVCVRRASDISQHKKNSTFISSPEVGLHTDDVYGTHHARDAAELFQTLGYQLTLHSSAMKVNTQYMHTLWFSIKMSQGIDYDSVMERLERDDMIALTEKPTASEVFSFGRDHGHYGRILNPTVIVKQTIQVINNNEVTGFCFTPQDGNSLLSSISAAEWFLYHHSYESKIQCLKSLIFKEV